MSTAAVPAGAGPLRVAIIDDHVLVREGLRSVLKDLVDPDVWVAYCGDSPLAATLTDPVVALLDMNLGPGSAPVAQNTRVLVDAGVRVVVVSAFDDGAAVRSALEAGALGFVPKRADVDVLAEALTTAARGELYLSMELASLLAAAPDVPDLSVRELEALRLYASGLNMPAVAVAMGLSPHTVREYLDRVRAKYAAVGRPARTRTQLYAEASRDGLLEDR